MASPALAQAAPGKLKGGVEFSLPAWFKPSLLVLREDVEEAHAKGRHVMLFLHLDECPYCERMLRESFARGETHDFMRRHFDVSMALRLAGYRDPGALRDALEFIQGRHYRTQAFAVWLETRDKPAVYALRDHPQFAKATDFRGYRKPLAILFEDRQCAGCARFHDKTLNHPDVLAEMRKFRFVRLDAGSRERIVAPDGTPTTPAQWAKALEFTTRPALVLYDEGREIFRFDGHLYHFHFKEALRYVSGGHHKRFPSISQYNAARRAELTRQGVDIDYAE